MQMPDVNVLVYAHREETPWHARYAAWLVALAQGPAPFALSELVLHGFVRVVTNPHIFDPPSTTKQTFQFVDALISRRACSVIRPGPDHWSIFRRLCPAGDLKGQIAPDAVHPALPIESGGERVTADPDFARFAPM